MRYSYSTGEIMAKQNQNVMRGVEPIDQEEGVDAPNPNTRVGVQGVNGGIEYIYLDEILPHYPRTLFVQGANMERVGTDAFGVAIYQIV